MGNKREKILLAVFAAAILIIGGSFLWGWFSRGLKVQKEQLAVRQTQINELRAWLAQKDSWQQREAWMEAHAAPVYEGQQSEAAFVRQIQDSLSRQGIETVEQRLQETRTGGAYVEVPIDLVLNSSLEQLVRWLYDTQRSDAFRVVSQIKMKSAEADTKIHTEISVVQLFDQSAPR